MGAPRQGRNVGGKYSRYPGYSQELGTTKFQDFLFEINDLPERQLTDDELSAAMREEHPTGILIHADYGERRSVRTVRRRYNTGTQGHGPAAKQSLPYWIEKGARVRGPYPDGLTT